MSIQSFVDSAKILYENNKYYEALCLTCIAVDASAALKYPKMTNAARYKKFLKDNFSTITRYGIPGIQASNIKIKVNFSNDHLKCDEDGYVDMEQIIYHVLRCGLVHKCSIDRTIQFTDTTVLGDWGDTFKIPKNIIWGLISTTSEQDGNSGK